MDRDGARNAKAEVFRKAFGFEECASAFGGRSEQPAFLPRLDSAIGERIARGRRTGELDPIDKIAVGFSATSATPDRLKLSLLLQSADLVHHPLVEHARQIIGATETDVIVTGRAASLSPLNGGMCRPLRIGASVSHAAVSAGTLGFFAECRSSGVRGFVSNNHILANENAGAIGDFVLQPATADGGGGPASWVARLNRFHPIDFTANATNYVDCAFAELFGLVAYEPAQLCDPLGLVPTDSLEDQLDLVADGVAVMKIGRTTGRTDGSIAVAAIDNITAAFGRGFARFDRQVAIQGTACTFSAPGDSGSLITTRSGRPVALLFSGTSNGISYASPIGAVVASLNVDLHTTP